MPSNTTALVLRNHDLYHHATYNAYLECRGIRTDICSLSYCSPSYDPVGRVYWDECGNKCPFNNRSCEEAADGAIEAESSDEYDIQHRDMRSFSREKNRPRKIRQDKRSCCKSYKGRRARQTEQRSANKRKKKEALSVAVSESKHVLPLYQLSFQPAAHALVQWDTRVPEDLDEWVSDMHSDLVRYTLFGQGADVFERTEEHVEVGEDFSAWAQRRIAEMRRVKEDRLRRGMVTTAKPMVWKRARRYGRSYNVYTGDARSTTRPTNAYDAKGHEMLRSVLLFPLRAVEGYAWFGEYEWAWHRNGSGCWEFGHAVECGEVMPCAHCCEEHWGFFLECGCKGFSGVAPEEVQRCSLVEWVDGEGREVILRDEEIHALNSAKEDELDGCWDIVSSVSSEAWSVVDLEV